MPIRQRLSSTDDGRPVVIKEASGPTDVERLVREAAVLRAAAHPGVVEVLADRPVLGGHELMLLVAGTRSAGDLRLPLTAVAGLLASLAATVADLHDLGLVHGRIQGDHVLVDERGRPVLCGFGEAIRFDPGAAPALACAVDVAGLGELLRHLVTTADGGDDGWEPIPVRRFRLPERWTVHARRALLNVADHATADDPTRRPGARALAADVLAALPVARLPGAAGGTDEAGAPPPSVPWPRRRFAGLHTAAARAAAVARGRPALGRWPTLPAVPTVPVVAVLGLGLLVFGIGGLLRPGPLVPGRAGPGDDGSGAAPPVVGAAASAAGSAASTTTAEPTALPEPAVAPTTSASCRSSAAGDAVSPASASTTAVVDHDGDGCPSIAVVGQGSVDVDGIRYLVGAPGDLLAVGDWDCDGRATVGLVERPSGLVFLFDGWASPEADRTVEAVATVDGAASVATSPGDRAGCDALVVTDGTGRVTEVAP